MIPWPELSKFYFYLLIAHTRPDLILLADRTHRTISSHLSSLIFTLLIVVTLQFHNTCMTLHFFFYFYHNPFLLRSMLYQDSYHFLLILNMATHRPLLTPSAVKQLSQYYCDLIFRTLKCQVSVLTYNPLNQNFSQSGQNSLTPNNNSSRLKQTWNQPSHNLVLTRRVHLITVLRWDNSVLSWRS